MFFCRNIIPKFPKINGNDAAPNKKKITAPLSIDGAFLKALIGLFLKIFTVKISKIKFSIDDKMPNALGASTNRGR